MLLAFFYIANTVILILGNYHLHDIVHITIMITILSSVLLYPLACALWSYSIVISPFPKRVEILPLRVLHFSYLSSPSPAWFQFSFFFMILSHAGGKLYLPPSLLRLRFKALIFPPSLLFQAIWVLWLLFCAF